MILLTLISLMPWKFQNPHWTDTCEILKTNASKLLSWTTYVSCLVKRETSSIVSPDTQILIKRNSLTSFWNSYKQGTVE